MKRLPREPWGPRVQSRIEEYFNKGLTVTSVTASQTLTPDYDVLLVDATGGAVTLTLPPAADATGHIIYAKKIDASANAMTLDGSGSETIDGAATKATTTQWVAYTIISNGEAWFIL